MLKGGVRDAPGEHPAQTFGNDTPNEGLCSTDEVAFIAFALGSGSIGDGLALAAFKGSAAPGPHEAEENLCGTFNYAPDKGA